MIHADFFSILTGINACDTRKIIKQFYECTQSLRLWLGLIYVYMGKKAEEWSEITTNTEYKFTVKHPASAAYNGSKWDSDDIFNKVSAIIKNQTNYEITW